MLNDDNQLNNDRDDNQPTNGQTDAPQAAPRRAVCKHSFRKVGAKRVCTKCGLKTSGGKPS